MHDQHNDSRQLQEELKSLRQQLSDWQRINDNLPVLVATAGFDGFYKEVNSAFSKILGWSQEEMLSRSFFEFVHPDDRAIGAEKLDELKSGNTLTTFVDRTLCKDGSYRWISWVVIPLLDRDVVYGIGKDITKEKSVLEALRQSEERYRQLADSTPDVIYIIDKTGRLLYANRVAGQYFGVDPQSLVGKTQHDLFPQEVVESHLERIKETFETGEISDRVNLYRFGDREVWLNVRTIPLRDSTGEITSLMGVCRDITKQKIAEEALKKAHDELEEKVEERTSELRTVNKQLQQSYDELEAIYNAMADGIIVIDIETHRFLRTNAASCRMLDYSEEELLSLSLDDIHPPEVIPLVIDHIQSVQNEINNPECGSIPFLRKDGSVFQTEIIGRFLFYDGRPCSMGIFRDITERLEAQQALERERQSLWKMLQASDHERQLIAYDIHDGLAQYLAAAGMELQAHDALQDNSPEDAQGAYNTAVELVRRSHTEARRLISEVRHPVIDERGLATAIVSMACEQQKCGGPKVQCHTSVEFDRLPPILENALYRMAQEALTNACKYSKSDKVMVTIVQEGLDVRLEIQDWGIGFDPKAIGEGHFGLESIRQRVRLLGGRLKVDSKLGSGTLVQAVVPIVEEHANE